MGMVISASTALKNAYSGNTMFSVDSFRKGTANRDVVSADQKALMRALNSMDKLDYKDTSPENTKGIYNRLMSYVDVYNNTVESGKESSSTDIKRTMNEMKKFSKEHADELADLGITLKSDGSLKVDTKKFKTATTRQVSKVFSPDSDYVKGLKKLTKKLRGQITRQPVEMDMNNQDLQDILGTGSKFNAQA